MENVGILPLKVLSANLIELIQFYFLTWSTYHASMREAAIPIIFGGGLVWAGIMAFKFPEDKFKGVVGTFVILVVLGILIAPAKDSSPMVPGNAQSPFPVAQGSVWTFRLAGNIYSLFRQSTDAVYDSNLDGEVTGRESFRTDQHAILYADAAEKMAESVKNSPGYEVVTAYMGMCSKAIEDSYNDDASLSAARGVGLGGSNLMGVNDDDRSILSGVLRGAKDTVPIWINALSKRWWNPALATYEAVSEQLDPAISAAKVDTMVASGIKLLEGIPEHKDPFSGGTQYGFKIPTKAYFDKENWEKETGIPLLDPRTHENGKYMHGAIANGSELNNDQAFLLYPKSCKDAYDLSNYVMASMRNSNNDNANTTDLAVKARDNMTAVARASELANRASMDYMRARGLEPGKMHATVVENVGDNIIGGLIGLSATIGEFMLRYKVPMMVSIAAMLAASLLVAFPLFCVMSVFLGPQILITFFKLIIFSFLIIYLNDLFLSMASDVLYFQEISSVQGFNTGFNAGMSATQAASTTKAILFSALTVIEVAVARLILWDDAKALAGFKPGSVGTDRAASMAKTIGGAVFTIASVGKAGAWAAKGVKAGAGAPGAPGAPGGAAGAAGGAAAGAARTISAQAANVASTASPGRSWGSNPAQFKGSLNPAPPTPPSSVPKA